MNLSVWGNIELLPPIFTSFFFGFIYSGYFNYELHSESHAPPHPANCAAIALALQLPIKVSQPLQVVHISIWISIIK